MIGVNPVLRREVRERLRTGRAYVAITVFVGLLLLLTWAVHTATSVNRNLSNIVTASASGRTLLEALAFGMLGLMAFLLPGIAAGSVTGERERETLIPLQVTLLSPRAIMSGKVLASSAFAALMLVGATPLFATAYLLGGVSFAEVARLFTALVVVAALLTTLAVTCSTLVRRTQAAVLMAYALTLILFVGAPFLFGMATVIDSQRGTDAASAPKALVLPNPVVAVALFTFPNDGVNGNVDGNLGASNGPLGGISREIRRRDTDGSFRNSMFGLPMWAVSFGSLVVGIGAGSLLGVRRLRTPARTER